MLNDSLPHGSASPNREAGGAGCQQSMQHSMHGRAAGMLFARLCMGTVGAPLPCHGPCSVMHAASAAPAGLGAWQPCRSAAACSGSARRQVWLALQRRQRPAEHSSKIACHDMSLHCVAARSSFGISLQVAGQLVCTAARCTAGGLHQQSFGCPHLYLVAVRL